MGRLDIDAHRCLAGWGLAGAHDQEGVALCSPSAERLILGIEESHGERVPVRERALGFGCRQDWGLQELGQLLKGLGRVRCDTPADQHCGPLGRRKGVRPVFDTPWVGRGRLGGGRLSRLGVGDGREDPVRHFQVGRAGAAAPHRSEGLVNGVRDIGGAFGLPRPLGDSPDEGELVVDGAVGVALAGHDHHRRALGECPGDPGHRVVHAGSRDHENGGGLSTGPRVPVRHVAGRLLVAGRDVPDAGLFVDAVYGLVLARAGHAEDDLYPLRGERCGQGLAAGYFRQCVLL